jgi:hypothetical protein
MYKPLHKNCVSNLIFYELYNIKHSLIYYQTPNYIFFTANTKNTTKQTHLCVRIYHEHVHPLNKSS